jgi:hypothetical protein
MSPHAGASKADIAAFEKALGVNLPEELTSALFAANGSEWTFARHEERFIPEGIATMSTAALWDHLLAPIADCDTKAFKGRFLPLGDDYSGRMVLLELKNGKILISRTEAGASLADYEHAADDLASYIEECEAEPPPPEPDPEPEAAEPASIPFPFAKRNIAVRGLKHIDDSRRLVPWLVPEGVPGAGYRLRHHLTSIPVAHFGSALFDTAAGPTLVTATPDELVPTVFKNLILVNEANAALAGRTQSQPLGGERVKATLRQAKILIYETSYKTYTSPPLGGATEVAVLALHSGQVKTLTLSLQGLDDAKQANAAVQHLLSFGFDWFA